MRQRHNLIHSPIIKSEIRRLKRGGFDRLEIARQMLALSGVIDHWPLFKRHGKVGQSENFQLPLP